VLNFAIPEGAQGAAGPGGGGSSSGNSFAGMYHAVSYLTTFYSINTPAASATEGDSVLAWIPNACTATSLSVFSHQTNNITVTLRVGSPAPMTPMLHCTTASGQCSVAGSVSVPAGSFLDIEIDGASGSTAGVWTSVVCQ
jgi:collagen type VII alpha